MEYTVFILMNSRGKYEVKGLLVLANMSTKSKAAVSCRNDAQRCTYRHKRLWQVAGQAMDFLVFDQNVWRHLKSFRVVWNSERTNRLPNTSSRCYFHIWKYWLFFSPFCNGNGILHNFSQLIWIIDLNNLKDLKKGIDVTITCFLKYYM